MPCGCEGNYRSGIVLGMRLISDLSGLSTYGLTAYALLWSMAHLPIYHYNADKHKKFLSYKNFSVDDPRGVP